MTRDSTDPASVPPEAVARAAMDAATGVAVLVEEGAGLRAAYVNDAGARMLGYTPQEVVGRDVLPLLAPEEQALLAQRGKGVDRRGASLSTTARHKDGGTRTLEVSFGATRHLGQPAYLALFREAPALGSAEAQLRRTLSLLTATLEATADGLMVVASDGTLASHNRKLAEVLAMPAPVLAARRTEPAFAHLRSQLADPGPFEAEVRRLAEEPAAEAGGTLELRDGRVLAWQANPQRLGGAVIGRVWGFRDVTPQRAAEEAREEAERRLSFLVARAPMAIFALDAEGRFTFAGGRLLPDLGVTPEEVVGRRIGEPRMPVPWRAGRVRRALEGATVAETFEAGDRTYELRLMPHLGDPGDGGRRGAVGVVTDVTERARHERERLADMARAAELERLREIDRFKARFINNAAQELSTPLTPLRAQCYLLRAEGDRLGERGRKAVDILDRNVERLQRIVRDLLDVARVEDRRMLLHQASVDLGKMVEEAVESYQAAAQQAGVALEASTVEGLRVEADGKRILQVLHNLLDNGVKFTPRGGRVSVELAEEGGQAVIHVADTGRGFRPEDAGSLFRPFVAAESEAGAEGRGTGLGLYISRHIVEEHGGSLRCESPGPGMGATFTVTLPREVPLARPDAAARGGGLVQHAAPPRGEGERTPRPAGWGAREDRA